MDPIKNCSGADDNTKRKDGSDAAIVLMAYDQVDKTLEPYRSQLFKSDHKIEFNYTLQPETDYSIAVDEKYLGKTTVQGSKEFNSLRYQRS